MLGLYLPVMPECLCLIAALTILILGAFFPKAKTAIHVLTQLTLVALVWLTWHISRVVPLPSVLFHQSFILDRLAVVLKLFTYLSVFVCLLFTRQYNEKHNILQHEFYVLILLSVLGMMVLISGENLITIYLGLELMSLPIYAMVALQRSKERCLEAAMKYFVIGAVASGLLLYGLSFFFGVAKSIDLGAIVVAMQHLSATQMTMMVFAMIFVIAGVAFKLGAVPFHMWVPDVYDGAPNSITLFLSSVPKLAAFALLARLFLQMMPSLVAYWQPVLIVIAVLSIALGNFAAISQSSLKRMLAYSSIAHMGYMLLGFCAGTSRGFSASLFYLLNYVVMTIGAFGLLVMLSQRAEEITEIKDLAGLNDRQPWLAFMLLLVLFSMAGIPPLVGFIAKVGLFEALIQAHLVWLAAVAVVLAIVGAYYYIRVVKVMYFESGEKPADVLVSSDGYLAMSFVGVSVLILGIFPGALFSLCRLIF
jgi:NADH-quinone oxidoreductase subunit N